MDVRVTLPARKSCTFLCISYTDETLLLLDNIYMDSLLIISKKRAVMKYVKFG